MARKTQIFLEDDLTGDLLKNGAGQTVVFSLEGTSYEIDLSDDNAADMRSALGKYTGVARKVSAGARRSPSGSAATFKRTSSGTRSDLEAIRAWAKANGHQVSERGRIAAAVVDAYDAAQ